MKTKQKQYPNKPVRMTLDHMLNDEECAAACNQAWNEVFGKDAVKNGSIHDQIFLAHFYMGERRLENLRQVDLFRKSQQLQDYRKAEDALKRGWGRWTKLELGLTPSQGKDKLKIRQCQLLDVLRRTQMRESRQEILSRFSVVIGCSAKKRDDAFFRLLGHTLDDPARTSEGVNDFAHVCLAYWLTGFWWLMPLKAVAADMARIQNQPALEAKYLQRLKKLKSQKRGDWCHCFFSANPPLIDYIENNGSPHLNALGRRLLS